MDMQIPGYTLIRKINDGGMASVYLATQLSVGRTVALKIMKPELDIDPQFHQRFQREAEIVGQLSHPNIVSIYDIGRYNGLNYISMDYLPNGSLDDKLVKGIAIEDTLKIVKAIASALDHAHKKGYVHRDIKPENILFRADDSAVLTDFGIARTIKSDAKMTQVGIMIGTPFYMSPEQAKGGVVDGRADLYSLGVLFYEMITGARPFQGDDAIALALQHINEAPPKLPSTLSAYQSVIDKLLTKNPAQRFQTGADFIGALQVAEENNAHPIELAKTSFQLSGVLVRLVLNSLSLLIEKMVAGTNYLINRFVLSRESVAELPIESGLNHPELSSAKTSLHASPLVSSTATSTAVSTSTKKTKVIWGSVFVVAVLCALFFVTRSTPTHRPFAALTGQAMATSKNQSTTDESGLYSLTIQTQPESARVRVLNISERYRPGMLLAPGSYQVEIRSPGYKKIVERVDLADANKTVRYTLAKESVRENGTEKENILVPELIAITAGVFDMGDLSAGADVTVKRIQLKKNYFIGVYEITFDQYDNFAIATNRRLPDDNGWGRGYKPVINVSWDDAQAYVNWLSKTTGEHYRLPSSAEWEYAARGNTTSAYWWGNSEEDAATRANCRSGCKSWLSGLFNAKSETVGSYPPNDVGLYDTSGNVAEWVQDCEQSIIDESNSDAAVCKNRLARGGSYKDSVKHIASHSFITKSHADFDTTIGFRVVKDEVEREQESEPERRGNFLQRIFSR